jgi:hypothetical protein
MRLSTMKADDLLKLTTVEMRLHDVRDDCKVTSLTWNEEDREGHNWTGFNFQCSGVPSELCLATEGGVVQAIREKYNLS